MSISTDNIGDKPGSGPPPAGSLLGLLPEDGLPCIAAFTASHQAVNVFGPLSPLITGAAGDKDDTGYFFKSPAPSPGLVTSAAPSESLLQQDADRAHLKFLQCDCALGDELVCILLQHRHLSVDLLIHERLREHGFIHLVVATPAVTDLQGQKVGPHAQAVWLAQSLPTGAHLEGHTLQNLTSPHDHPSPNAPPQAFAETAVSGTKPAVQP